MLDAKNYLPGTPIYTFVDKEGNNIHVDSELLRQWCAEHKSELEIVSTPVNTKIAISFLENNVIDLEHVKLVLKMDQLDPIIYGHTGTYCSNGSPDVILIDGHHRFFLAWICKSEWIPAYILRPEQWQQFQINGLPSVTEDELRAAPVRARKKE